jgi:hypothetical protein
VVKNYFGVNTDKLPLDRGSSDYVKTNRLCINHYWTRDGDYFYNKKIPRQKKWGANPLPAHIIPIVNAKKDEQIFQFIPALKSAMVY